MDATEARPAFISTLPTVAGGVPSNLVSLLAEASLAESEFLRLPKPGGRCRLSSLSRSTLLELGAEGFITIKRIRRPGRTRGVVLIEKASLLNYLRGIPAENLKGGE